MSKRVFAFVLLTFSGLFYFNVQASPSPVEEFDPYSLMRNTVKGQQLLEISNTAKTDVELASQQLESLSATGIQELGLTYQVALVLARININLINSDFDKVKTLLDDLHLLGVKPNNEWILSVYFERLASLALRQGKFQKAFEDSSKSIELATPLNYQFIIANAKTTRAVVQSKFAKSGDALKDYLAALEYYQKTNDLHRIVAIYGNQVTLYLDRQEYMQALSMSDKAIAALEKMPRPPIRLSAVNYINRAIALAYLEHKDEELDAYIKAQEFAVKSNDVEVLASIYANLSDYFLRYKNYSLAIERAKRCIETADKISNKNLTAICLLNQGLASVHNNDADNGIAMIKSAHQLAESENMQSTLIDVYLAYIEAYKAVGDYQQANIWLQTRYDMLLEKAKNDRDNDFLNMEANFKEIVDQREQLHNSLKSDMAANFLSQESLMRKLWIGLSALALMLFVSFLIIARLKKQLKLKYYT